jgi:hypothetical protein
MVRRHRGRDRVSGTKTVEVAILVALLLVLPLSLPKTTQLGATRSGIDIVGPGVSIHPYCVPCPVEGGCASAWVIEHDNGSGYCGSSSAYGVWFFVAGVLGHQLPANNLIDVNGQTYANGSLLALVPGSLGAITIQAASISSGYQFGSWISNTGVISHNQSSTTTFTLGNDNTNSGYPQTDMVLSQPITQQSTWGGLVYYGTMVTATMFTVVVHTTIAPSESSTTPGWKDEDVTLWTGIGGVLGNQSLWQAGIYLADSWRCNNGTNPSASPSVCANLFYQAYTPGLIGTSVPCSPDSCFYRGSYVGSHLPTDPWGYNLWNAIRGKAVTVSVWVTSQTGCYPYGCEAGWFSVAIDGVTFWGSVSGLGNPNPVGFDPSIGSLYQAPNWKTAEWVAEIDSSLAVPLLSPSETPFVGEDLTDNGSSATYLTLPLLNDTGYQGAANPVEILSPGYLLGSYVALASPRAPTGFLESEW